MTGPNTITNTSNQKRPNTRPLPSSHSPSSATSSATISYSTTVSHSSDTKARPRDIRQRRRNKSLLGRLSIPIPPSLQNSSWLQSPLSMFRRPYPSSRTPDKEEDQWLGDTMPMHVDSDNAHSASGSLRRKAGSGEMGMTPPGQIGKPTKNATEESLTASTSSSTVALDIPGPNHSPTAGKAESGVS